jgi:hypothetical protein
MPYVENSDYIIGFGNQFTMKTWSENFPQKNIALIIMDIQIQDIFPKIS